jgi:hypothetical protein
MRKAILLIVLLLAAAVLPAETYMLLLDGSLDGEADPRQAAALEGLMSAMFEAGQVTFDPGPYRPQADWQKLQFKEPLDIALAGGAHYLATIRLAVRTLPAPAGGKPPAAEAEPPPSFALQASFQLWDPGEGTLLGQGKLELDNLAEGGELSYEDLLFRAGERTAAELLRLAARR